MDDTQTWRKHVDTRYIAGEDLKNSKNGLRPEMVVTVADAKDVEAFDQKTQSKVSKTGIFLKEYPSGKMLYKPVIVNKTNAVFFETLTGSLKIADAIGVPVVIYAMPDTRHGFVVRFKKYIAPSVDPNRAISELLKAKTPDDVDTIWKTLLTPDERKNPAVMAKGKEIKEGFTK